MFIRIFLMIMAVCMWVSPIMAEELTGKSIIEEQQKRHQSDNEFSDVALTLINRKGKEKNQNMVIYLLKKDKYKPYVSKASAVKIYIE